MVHVTCILEAVPNIDVGRDEATLDAIVHAVETCIAQCTEPPRSGEQARGAALLADVHRDGDHDRAVLTIVGHGSAFEDALRTLARETVTRLDLHAGHGVHPRVGVLDVLPIVPLDRTTVAEEEAHALVERLARSLGAELGLPFVAYGMGRDGESRPGAGSTGAVRRGGPAAVIERVEAGELELLGGPASLHPTAGVTMIGVRPVLVAFNVDLASDDLELARTIAARIRASSDGDDALPGIRALGLRLASRGCVQVSTNVERPRECGPARVLETVTRLADEADVGAAAAELVGLAPDHALGPLRYACTRVAVPLLASADASLDAAVARVRG